MTLPASPGAAARAPLPVAFLGDSHLVAGDHDTTHAFEQFVASAPGRFHRLVLLGDVFDLWLARPHLHEEHHRRALGALGEARARGLLVDYAVGNRDFGVEQLSGAPFTRIATEVLLDEADAGARPPWVAEHGDLVNEDDAQYRRWRRLSRSAPVLGTFLALPTWLGIPLSQRIERRLRTTNLEHKRRFPMENAVRRAQSLFASTGARFLVLGHFHEERRFTAPPGEVIVLPDWKRARRHAEWRPDADGPGTMTFADSLG